MKQLSPRHPLSNLSAKLTVLALRLHDLADPHMSEPVTIAEQPLPPRQDAIWGTADTWFNMRLPKSVVREIKQFAIDNDLHDWQVVAAAVRGLKAGMKLPDEH